MQTHSIHNQNRERVATLLDFGAGVPDKNAHVNPLQLTLNS